MYVFLIVRNVFLQLCLHCYLKHCGPVQRALVDQQAHLWSEEGAFAGVAAAVYACKGQGKKKYIR